AALGLAPQMERAQIERLRQLLSEMLTSGSSLYVGIAVAALDAAERSLSEPDLDWLADQAGNRVLAINFSEEEAAMVEWLLRHLDLLSQPRATQIADHLRNWILSSPSVALALAPRMHRLTAESRIRASLAEHLITVERAVPDAGQKEQLLLAVKAFKGHSRSRAATLLAKRLVELQETGDATLNDLVQRLKAQ